MRRFCKIIRLPDGSNGIELVESLPPRSETSPSPTDLPMHVLSNYELNHEIEAEYLNRPREFRRNRGNSTTAFKKFYATRYHDREKSSNEIRKEFFDELEAAVEAIESLEPHTSPREETYEDDIIKFGGRFTGCSEVMPHQRMKRTVLIGE